MLSPSELMPCNWIHCEQQFWHCWTAHVCLMFSPSEAYVPLFFGHDNNTKSLPL